MMPDKIKIITITSFKIIGVLFITSVYKGSMVLKF